MKRMTTTLVVLSLAGALAACGKKEGAAKEATPPPAAPASGMAATAPSADMSNMAMPADVKMAKGAGVVTAVDPVANTITVQHGPIPEANWPAMTMAFKASPALVGQVKPGDKVAFDLKLEGGGAEITAISKPQG